MTKLELQNQIKNIVQEQIAENFDNISSILSELPENKELYKTFIKVISFSTNLSVQLVMEILCQSELITLDGVPDLKPL